jgi:hypothetical protein
MTAKQGWYGADEAGISILLQSQLLFLLVKNYTSVKYVFPVKALGLLVSE